MDDAIANVEPRAAEDTALSKLWAVLIGAGVAVAALAAVAGLAALLLWAGVPGGKRAVAVIAAGGMLAAIAVGAWAGTGRTRPPGSLVAGGLVPVLAIGAVLLVAWPLVGPMADFRSVAIALGWIDAPNLGTGPTAALHRVLEGQQDRAADGVTQTVETARRNAIQTGLFLGGMVLSLVLAGVLGAALHRRRLRSTRAHSLTDKRALPMLAALVLAVAVLAQVAWPSLRAMVDAVVDFDQSAGPEVGVVITEVVSHPDAMWGKTVTVSAAVQRMVGPHAAVIGNDAPMVGTTLLIVSDKPLREHVLLPGQRRAEFETGDVVQVTGTVRQRDSAALRQELGDEVVSEVRASEYQGRAVLVVEAIDLDVPATSKAGDPELNSGSAGYDAGVTVDDIVYHPEAHVGITVTVSGEVEEPLHTPHAFVLTGRSLLVISPEPRPELFVEVTAYVTGEVRIFDLREVEERTGVDLDDEKLRPYEGQPFIMAESVTVVK